MKKIFILFSIIAALSSTIVKAQSFSVTHDTINYSWPNGYPSTIKIYDYIINPGATPADSIYLKWKIISSDFPSDWIDNTGICDNNSCYSMSTVLASSGMNTSRAYHIGTTGDFHLQIFLATATTNGCYYATIRLYNVAVPTDSATATFIVCKVPTAVPTVKPAEDINIYPNPATSELNVVYDASADVKNIAVYNIIGKVMTVYKVTSNSSANLNLENIPSGIYFVRLMNAHGQVVATRKFTKQ